MNTISFKATLIGYPQPNEEIAKEFSNLTKNDKKHTLIIVPKEYKSDNDRFVLTNNGRKTVEYESEFIRCEDQKYNIKQLLSILNITKLIEARGLVKESIENKKKQASEAEFHSMDCEKV